ncbi:hypothetical protein K523DRAFT_125423 [Schizophyllum commune Tattone D]|nr:hypothetical protein K523DRAFT_125423 [Schizophyllum commune Tattone D]
MAKSLRSFRLQIFATLKTLKGFASQRYVERASPRQCQKDSQKNGKHHLPVVPSRSGPYLVRAVARCLDAQDLRSYALANDLDSAGDAGFLENRGDG